MDELISRQVLDLWNRYKPTIAVDAMEYDRELKKLLSTNLAEVGTDAISREQAIDALRDYLVEKRCPDDGTLTCRLIENEVINKLPTAQPEIIRCKDCRKNPNWEWVGCPMAGKNTRKPDDFCSYAERREVTA